MFILQGTNLDQIRLNVDDVVIKIGKSECYVTSTGRQLTCLPPKEQPIPVKSRLYPEVEVCIAVCSMNDCKHISENIHVFFIIFILFYYIFSISNICIYLSYL